VFFFVQLVCLLEGLTILHIFFVCGCSILGAVPGYGWILGGYEKGDLITEGSQDVSRWFRKIQEQEFDV
jgi:hypothetical protein